MDYADFKDLLRRAMSGKVLLDKAFCISKKSKNNGYQRDIISIVYKFFEKSFAANTSMGYKK